ncbi:hypothetical protein GY45DRAFT_1320836 [Cubamyces sp. BRFM 1775]|nr:hypothetical protein GY45DRAFT_1320836 [Cubamyces sp. BRFM 1775]
MNRIHSGKHSLGALWQITDEAMRIRAQIEEVADILRPFIGSSYIHTRSMGEVTWQTGIQSISAEATNHPARH